MNQAEAQHIAQEELARWRSRPYAELRRQAEDPNFDGARSITGASETQYNVDVNIFLDDATTGCVRVAVSIDDGGWRAFFGKTTAEFFIYPDGRIE